MKKKRALVALWLMALLLCSVLVLVACGGEENQPQPATKLATPVVTLSGDTATWSADASADKFEISVSGELSYVENTVTSRRLTDGQTFKVRAVGDGSKYVTGDWSNEVTYTEDIPNYTITWKNGDTVLKSTTAAKGTVPAYDGETPVKDADAQYTYTFSGWSPAIATANGDATYTAVFTSEVRAYTVIWKNGDAELERDVNVPYGTVPTYNGVDPTKAPTAQYSYTFNGWTPQVGAITGETVYQAQFSETLNTYTVTFYSEDGNTVLDEVTVAYGATATYTKAYPVKNATAGHTYEFEKWVTSVEGTVTDDLSNVTGNRSVYACFKPVARKMTVYIVSNNIDFGTVSVGTLVNIPYGSAITVNGNAVEINGQTVTAHPKAATAQYTYTFTSWSAPETVGNDTIITASFSRTLNTYTVIWKNGDSELERDENVEYGVTPVYNGPIPTKPADNENIYTFSGWLPVISTVTGDVTYIAQFANTANQHIVIFYDEDGTTELGRAVVGHGETVEYPNALPTKAPTLQIVYSFDKWVTEVGGDIEATFTNVVRDMDVYAKYAASTRTYTVTFRDYDGSELSKVNVAYGAAATAPFVPEREGFRFDCWDKAFDNITEDITVTAKYVQQFEVRFLNDNDNSIIKIQYVDYNTNATAPQAPEKTGYRFIGWNIGFTNVVSDLTVKALYIKQYKVAFVDYNGVVLKECWVDPEASAVPPADPALENYEFDGWDKTYNKISSDLIITATYKLRAFKVQFVMPDGTAIGTEQNIEYGFSAIAPDCPEVYLIGSGDETRIYTFTRWNKSFTNITGDLVVEAVYETECVDPVVIIEFSEERNGDASLYIYNHASKMLNALEFSINYGTSTGNISIDEATVNSACPLSVKNVDGENNNQYVTNNNEKFFTFAWSDANGKQLGYCSKLFTFAFSADGLTVGAENFVIDSCSVVISDSDGENLEKVTPIIVYR